MSALAYLGVEPGFGLPDIDFAPQKPADPIPTTSSVPSVLQLPNKEHAVQWVKSLVARDGVQHWAQAFLQALPAGDIKIMVNVLCHSSFGEEGLISSDKDGINEVCRDSVRLCVILIPATEYWQGFWECSPNARPVAMFSGTRLVTRQGQTGEGGAYIFRGCWHCEPDVLFHRQATVCTAVEILESLGDEMEEQQRKCEGEEV